MSPIPAPAKVLVTGASGFIAVWLCKTLMEKGYTVVGTVRSKAKGVYLEQLFEKHGFGKDRFSFVIVEDMGKAGAFDQAVVGVDAVEHTASPVNLNADDPQELVVPAVRGVTQVLESVKRFGPTVKRVVFTSSVAAVVTEKPPPPGEKLWALDESDWNVTSPKIIEEKGRDAPGLHKYRMSKVMAERAAWAFMEANKDSINFDLVTICPPMVYGPVMQDIPNAKAINESVQLFRTFTSFPEKTEKELLAPANHSGYWADVRDVTAIHALALGNPNAGGERFIVTSGPDSWQNFLDAIHKAQPGRDDVPKGYPSKGKEPAVAGKLIASKAARTFEYKFMTCDEMAPATLKALRERGF